MERALVESHGLVVVETKVGTTTQESGQIEHALGIPAAEEVRQVEHEVQTRSHILVLIDRVDVGVETTLALPAVSLDAGSKPRIELVADTELYVRRNQVLELGLTECILSTTLEVEESVLLELILCAIGSRVGSLCIGIHANGEEQ